MVLLNFVQRLLPVSGTYIRIPIPQPASQLLLQPSFESRSFGMRLRLSRCQRFICSALLLVLLLSGCGPESASSEAGSSAATTEKIAMTYQATQDLAEAQAQLAQLDVANVNQWLLLTTESAIKNNGNNSETNALVKLSLDLGLRSNVIVDYARQNALLENQATATTAALGSNDSGAVNNAVAANLDKSANQVGRVIVPLATSEVVALQPTTVVADQQAQATSSTASVDQSLAPTATAESALVAPTVELVATATPEATVTPETQPSVRAASGINVRTGPGVDYGIAGAMSAGESAQILNKNQTGDWWEVLLPSGTNGWVYGSLVQTDGDVSAISVALNIPTPPPTPVPAPTEVAVAPVEVPPVEAAPVGPAPGGPDFRVVERRLWDVVENGGQLNGISVTCGEKRQLVVNVLDAAGNRLNGVAVQAIYGAQEVFVSGSQGKGDGVAEFVLGGGQALKVIRDADGREVSSEEVYNLSTKPWEIPYETLIGGHFCTDEASCKSFVDHTGCYGHYSWTVTFQRSY